MHGLLLKYKTSGFTIIELLIVVVIIAILAGLVIVGYNGITQSARDKSVISDAEGIATEVTRYSLKHNGVLGSAVTWYSGNGTNPNLQFTPSAGNVVDVVASSTEYCIRVYNTSANKNAITNSYEKGSATTSCTTLTPSYASRGLLVPFVANEQTVVGTKTWTAIAMSSDATKLAAVNGAGYIITSTDSGATWTDRTSAGSKAWTAIAMSSDGTKIVAGPRDLAVSTSINSGVDWTLQSGSTAHGGYFIKWFAVTASTDGTKLIGTETTSFGDYSTGGFYYSTNSGATWTSGTGLSGGPSYQKAALSSDGTKAAGVGTGTYVYTSTNSGATWTSRTASGLRMWAGIASSADGTKLAAADSSSGYIYTSTDSGVTWTQQTGSGARTWSSIASSADGTKLIASVSTGYLYTSSNSGVTWVQQTDAGSKAWKNLTMSSDGTKFVATVTGGYLYTGQYNP